MKFEFTRRQADHHGAVLLLDLHSANADRQPEGLSTLTKSGGDRAFPQQPASLADHRALAVGRRQARHVQARFGVARHDDAQRQIGEVVVDLPLNFDRTHQAVVFGFT